MEFELLPGTGHLPYEECPEVLARLALVQQRFEVVKAEIVKAEEARRRTVDAGRHEAAAKVAEAIAESPEAEGSVIA